MRECILKGDNRKGYFHGWSHKSYIVEPSFMLGGHSGGIVADTRGIVELEDGSIIEVKPNEIIFTEPPESKREFAARGENIDIGAYENIHNG